MATLLHQQEYYEGKGCKRGWITPWEEQASRMFELPRCLRKDTLLVIRK
jgi:hypothetical protein